MQTFKIELELNDDEARKLKDVLCLGMIVSNEGRMSDEHYAAAVKLAKIINEKINYESEWIMDQQDTQSITNNGLIPYVRQVVKYRYKAELVEIN